jgi:N-methylhydantoinase A/oxoprolinase/acetone carboxylase beta subunit
VGASKALVHWGIQDEMERAHKTVRESFVRQRLAELQAAQEEAEKQQQQQEQQKQEEKSKKKPQQQSQAAASGPRK